jgi:uncharacterized protein (TIGR00730 family)
VKKNSNNDLPEDDILELPTPSRSARNLKGLRGERRKHLEQRLTSLNRRTLIIENELSKLDDNRFYRTCIFGSARIRPDTKAYNDVVKLAEMLSADGVDILTGGGPGLMEAANLGAKQGKKRSRSKSLSYGISIQLDFEPEPNKHLDIKHHHHKFSSRLDQFMRLSHSVICTPGGIGTVLEFFFCWQLIQVKHISPRPIILLDREFWLGMLDWMKAMPLSRALVGEKDFDVLKIADSPEEAYDMIADHLKQFRETNPITYRFSPEKD